MLMLKDYFHRSVARILVGGFKAVGFRRYNIIIVARARGAQIYSDHAHFGPRPLISARRFYQRRPRLLAILAQKYNKMTRSMLSLCILNLSARRG